MLYFVLFGLFVGVQCGQITIKSGTGEAIWIGIYNYKDGPQLNLTGFILNEPITLDIPHNWKGKIWPRTACIPNTGQCDTGDCGDLECHGNLAKPPYTLLEVEFNGDIGTIYTSLEEGYNMGVLTTTESQDGKACYEDCIIDPDTWGLHSQCDSYTTACFDSICGTFNTDQYCCRGDYATPDKCNPNLWGPSAKNLMQIFKNQCPTALTYHFDQPKRACIPKGNKITIDFRWYIPRF